jgi:hypothetical protein
MQFPLPVSRTQYLTDKQDIVVPSTEENLLAAYMILIL